MFPKAIFFGDSITQLGWSFEGGWLSILAANFVRMVDIIGRGYSGYNTRMCKPLLPIIIPDEDSLKDCVFFVIMLGANDACIYGSQHVPVNEYKANLTWMIDYLRKFNYPSDRILLITLPPVDENKWGAREIAEGLPLGRKLANCPIYATACKETASANNVGFLNLFESMFAQKDWERFLSDGLHFSREGSEFLAKLLEPIIKPKLDSLDPWFPNWQSIDVENPEKSILEYIRNPNEH